MTAERDVWRDHLTKRLVQCDVPEALRPGLLEYVVARRPVGGFLTAVLANDLKDACIRADPDNVQHLRELVLFLVNYVTADCWGSRKAVDRWLADPEPPEELFE